MFTARALGAMYGALANGGALADGTVVLSVGGTAALRRRAADPALDVEGWPTHGRQTCGFSPWLGHQLETAYGLAHQKKLSPQQKRLTILGHPGMGGCCAYADLDSGLAVAVLKNSFSPEVLNAGEPGSPGSAFFKVDSYLRRRLMLPGMSTGQWQRQRQPLAALAPAHSSGRRAARSPVARPRPSGQR